MSLHRNAARVQAALVAAGSGAVVRELPASAHTSAQAATALGVKVDQIAKSLVFVADGQPVLIVLCGADRLDPARLARHLGANGVRRADADTVREATGFPIGGVSPVGHAAGLRVLVDQGPGHLPGGVGGRGNAERGLSDVLCRVAGRFRRRTSRCPGGPGRPGNQP